MDLNVGSVVAYLRLDNKGFGNVLTSTMKRFKSVVSSTVRTITTHLKRATIAVTAYAVASLKAFASFEDAMTRSAAVTTNATGLMRREMERTALQMSKSSVLSAKELAEGYFALGQAGFTAAQSIKALPVVVDFAIASQVQLDTATRYLVRTLEGLGMASDNATTNMKQMERVSNVFTFAAIKTTAEIQDFAIAMTHAAAPALRLVNKSMEEGTAVLMAFARAGIVGAEAGTLLWTTVRDLQRASIKSRAEWDRLNLSIYDVNGKMRNLADIFGDLEDRFAAMSDEGKKINLMMLGFQDRSLRGIQALMGFSDEIRGWLKEMKSISFLTKQISEKYLKSFLSAMKMLWNQVKDVSIAFGYKLAPAIRGLAEDFAENQGIIKGWVVAVGIYMAEAIEHVRKFVRYIKFDMEGGIQTGLDIIKVGFMKFGEGLMIIMEEIFVTLGANVVVWFQRGFAQRLEFNAVSDKMLNEAMGVQSKWERYFKLLTMDAEDIKKYAMQVQIAQEKAQEKMATGFFDAIKKEAYPTIPINFELVTSSLKGIAEEAKIEINKILGKSTWKEFGETLPEIREAWLKVWKNLKTDTEPYIDTATISILTKFENLKNQLKILDIAGIIFTKPAEKDTRLPHVREAEKAMQAMRDGLILEGRLLDENYKRREKILKIMPLFAEFEKKFGDFKDWQGNLLWSDFEMSEWEYAFKDMEEELDKLEKKQRSFSVAFGDQMSQWIDDATNGWQRLGEVAVNTINSFADTLATALETGEDNWKAFGAAALRELNRMIIKMIMADTMLALFGGGKTAEASAQASATTAISASAAAAASATEAFLAAADAARSAALAGAIAAGNAVGSMVGGSGNFSGGGGAAPGGGSTVGVALGGILNRGLMMAFAAGGVVTRPTAFGMQNNRTGLMGEAGPEAIMPLSRNTSGELGVKASQPNINFNPQMKLVIVRDEKEAQLETMRSAAGEKIIVQKVARNRNVLG